MVTVSGRQLASRRAVLRAGVGLGVAGALGMSGQGVAGAATVRTATVDGVFIEYVRESLPLSRSLVFVHGGGHASWCWAPYLQYFAGRGWNCFAMNWYSHGRSRALPTDVFARRSIAAVTYEIHRAVQYTATTPIIVGHSMGALAAQAYAAQHDVAGLVLLAPTAPEQVGNPLVPIPVDPAVPWGPPPFEMAQQMFFTGFDEAVARQYHAKLGPESAQAILEVTGRAAVSVPAAAVLDHVSDIQVVAAQDDILSPPDVTSAIADYYGAEYHLMPGMGHDGLLLGPNWQSAAALVSTFVEGL